MNTFLHVGLLTSVYWRGPSLPLHTYTHYPIQTDANCTINTLSADFVPRVEMAVASTISVKLLSKFAAYKFPMRLVLAEHAAGGVDTLIDHVGPGDMAEVGAMITSPAAKATLGPIPKRLEDFMSMGVNFCFKDMTRAGKVYAFTNVVESPLCRSNQPIMSAGR